jgi:4-hydroxybenzoyl-CoA reductase subunit beta
VLTLPRFEFLRPSTLEEALAHLGRHAAESLIVAGGTDAVPNLKHRLHEPRFIVHLGALRELHFLRHEREGLRLGPMVTLGELAREERVRRDFPALARAAGLVAGPQLRNMGTLGGNLCLDTRCTYYNQTFFWRESLGFCLKKSGDLCHVVPAGKRCVAAHSSDVAPVLIALEAEVEIAAPAGGRRRMTVDEFFVADGIHNNVLAPGELVTEILVPARSRGLRSGYQKLRPRAAIDFPMLSVAFAARVAGGVCEGARLVVSAIAARPRVITGVEAIVRGRPLDEGVAVELAQAAWKQCHPLINVSYDSEYRREMVPVYVRRAVAEARGES